VVATCYGGSREAVSDGETGFIVNPFDTAAFSDRLARLLTDAGLARRMGDAGRARLLAGFTPARQVRDMEAVYADAVARRRAR
jgi:glycosyltransferase involved in cell wall biosynthesis